MGERELDLVALDEALSDLAELDERQARIVELRRLAEQQSILERDHACWQAYTASIAGALSAVKTGDFHQAQIVLLC